MRRLHLLLWVCSFIGGIGGDVIFSFLPLADNFFHGQATIMISPRLPLYIVLFYSGWFYLPVALAWRLKLPAVAESCLVSILCLAFYWPWDVVGAKMLWWSWHDSDSNFTNRYLNVPLASTMFVLMQCFSFAMLMRLGIGCSAAQQHDDDPPISLFSALRVAGCCCLTVPMFLIIMPLTQMLVHLEAPPPSMSTKTIWRTVAGLLSLLILSCLWKKKWPLSSGAYKNCSNGNCFFIVVGVLTLHFGSLTLALLTHESSSQLSKGIHQTYGSCDTREEDFAGYRYVFVCQERHSNTWSDFVFHCGHDAKMDATTEGTTAQWYTICGTPKTSDWVRDALLLTCLCATILVIAVLLGATGSHVQVEVSRKKHA
jgi:hypothetical protein